MSLNHKAEFKEDMSNLQSINGMVSGNEGLFSDIFSSVSKAALSGAKIAGGSAVDGIVGLFKKANRSLVLAYGENKTQFEMINKMLGKTSEEAEVKFPKTILAKITSNGEVSNIDHSLNNLIGTLKKLDNHRLDLESYYHKELSLFSEYKSIKSTDDAIKVIQKLDALTYPEFKLDNKEHSMLISVILPAGKTLSFDKENQQYRLLSEDITGKESDEVFTKDDVKSLMRQLDGLDDIYSAVRKANENYIKYLEKFNTVVKDAFVYIDDLKGKISTSLITDLQSRLEGNPHVFAFYSGFLPKVITYVDGYIDIMSNHLSKQFN